MKLLPLDKLYSEFIRLRAMTRVGGCERCLTPKTSWKSLQCSHFHGRARKSVRFDPENGCGLCPGCHMFLTANPLEHTEWFKKHLGEDKFDLLNSRMRQMEKPDQNLIMIYLKAKIKEGE